MGIIIFIYIYWLKEYVFVLKFIKGVLSMLGWGVYI